MDIHSIKKNIYYYLCLQRFHVCPEKVDNMIYYKFIVSLNKRFRKENNIDDKRPITFFEEKKLNEFLSNLLEH